MLHQIHKSHISIKSCLRRARESKWRMNAEGKDYVSKCLVCQSHQPKQCRESMKSYHIAPRPWSAVGEDLFQLGHHQFLIILDYWSQWSGFFEVEELTKITSKSVISATKVQFTRYGIPNTLISIMGLSLHYWNLRSLQENYKLNIGHQFMLSAVKRMSQKCSQNMWISA